jgi:AraC-like DNA-binding protein
MSLRVASAAYERVTERRRAVALARHLREAEGLSITQIADQLGRSPATIKAYFYDPTGEKARAVMARYVGVCRGCGAYTPAAHRQGRRLRVLQGLPPGRNRAPLDARARSRGDVRLARPLRAAAIFL